MWRILPNRDTGSSDEVRIPKICTPPGVIPSAAAFQAERGILGASPQASS